MRKVGLGWGEFNQNDSYSQFVQLNLRRGEALTRPTPVLHTGNQFICS